MNKMENWIEHITEPKRLYLAWQAADHMGNRFRWAVGILEPHAEEAKLRYLTPGSEFEELNQGKTYNELCSLGYAGYPAFSLRRSMHADGVIQSMMRRLPPRNRPDFREYMRQFRFAPGTEPSDFALLGNTEAKLPSDGFSLVDPLDSGIDRLELMIEVAGYRYYVDEDRPLSAVVGAPAEFQPEPENLHDRGAVRIKIGERTIGYVNRLQAPTFLQWLREQRVSGFIQRLNGKQGHPRAFVFVRVVPAQSRKAA